MENVENYLSELKEIRKIMTESNRFMSLSGLSGILIGIYALIGSLAAYKVVYFPFSTFRKVFVDQVFDSLFLIAGLVLGMSLLTGFWLTWERTKRQGKTIWNASTRLMLLNVSIPLIAGGLFMLIFAFRGMYTIVASSCLIFYGLALVSGAKFSRKELFYMGLLEIGLGLLAAIFPGIGLIFWAVGFGVLHIIYGAVMYFRYEMNQKSGIENDKNL